MKKLRLFYNESKDQSVPFALPALKSYKQNLLFPDDPRKTNTSQFPSIETTENSRTPTKQRSLRNNKPSQSPRRGFSPSRVTTTPLRPFAPNKNISKNPSTKPPSRSTDPVRPSNLRSKKPSTTIPEKILPSKSPGRLLETPKPGPKISKTFEVPKKIVKNFEDSKKISNNFDEGVKKIDENKKNEKKSPSRSLENTQEYPKVNRNKPESAKGPLRSMDNGLPLREIKENRRSNSIASVSAGKNPIRSPRIQTNSSGSKMGDFQSIPEYPSKNPSRASATRSLSRKRPKKNKKGSYFNFDSMYFRMSDLSIYPLF
jgi:hypothetical protein